MNIHAVPGLILVEEQKNSGTKELKSGIAIPESIEGQQRKAKVVSIGYFTKISQDGRGFSYEPTPCKLNDMILFKDGTGWTHKEDNKEYRFLRYDDVLAILEDHE